MKSSAMRFLNKGRLLHAKVPPTRDPFVNANLTSLGPDERGVDRFWMCTLNTVVGCTGALVDEFGQYRLYQFPMPHGLFYSAALEDENTLWLSGQLSTVVRLDLRSGQFKAFDTGLPSALLFQGMVVDPTTRKLFAAAYPSPQMRACSFDLKTGRTVKVYDQLVKKNQSQYPRVFFPNGDGSYTIVLHVPDSTHPSGEELWRWDPVREEVTRTPLPAVPGPREGMIFRLVADDRGHRYFPHRGWFDPATQCFDSSSLRPEREATWFGRHGQTIFGVAPKGSDGEILSWNMATGAVKLVCSISDALYQHPALTASGKVVCLNYYGIFSRYNGQSGALEMTRTLPTDRPARIEAIQSIGGGKLIGAPNIVQRFWQLDLKTGRGEDCGRAASSTGEVLLMWSVGRKAYMAAYYSGELTEYDPARPARFPENPRVVADPPGGMRPVAGADDGRVIFYSCGAYYGKLGSTLTRYDTKTGLAQYQQNPLGDQQIWSLIYERTTRLLLASTTITSDGHSCTPTAKEAVLARLRSEDLQVESSVPAPPGTTGVKIVGPLGKGKWLGWFQTAQGNRWAAVDFGNLRTPREDELKPFPEGFEHLWIGGRPGQFLLYFGDRVEVWDFNRNVRVRELIRHWNAHSLHVEGRTVYVARGADLWILKNEL